MRRGRAGRGEVLQRLRGRHCRIDGRRTSTVTARDPAAQPTSFASGRYEVKRFLGEGGKKRVYLTHDTLLDRDVAFALIKTEGLDDAGRQRIQREAQAMGRLGSHANIVTIHDIGQERDQPFLVIELMDGGDDEGLIEKAEDHRVPLEQALRIAIETCRGLEFAHERGIVHRDLKPGNVWLTADGIAKIGDFGLAVAVDRSRLTQAGMMVGTVSYMPPEQALGGEVTPRSNLYSLGAMLYELVTGRPPFLGDDTIAIIGQHLNTAPVAPSWHSDQCPPDQEALIMRLLEKDPSRRPENASEVLEALGLVDPAGRSAPHTGSEENPLERLARGVFVGREPEVERLRRGFDDAFSGRGSLVMLVGEPGIGKTRTTQEMETYARMRGAQALWGRSHESGGAPAFWPWVQIERAYGAVNDAAQLRSDVGSQGPELLRLFPDLKQLIPDIGDPMPMTDPESAQFRMFDAYVTFIRAASSRVPLLLVLDDLHWADKPTLQLLQHLAREVSSMRVLVVGTYRDTDLSRTHPLSESLATLNREPGFQRLNLRGLSQEEVGEYVRVTAGVTPSRRLLEKLYEETEGNPFFLQEVVALLTQEGTLTRDTLEDMAIPDGVKEALGRRLDLLSPEANELLTLAAVMGRDFGFDLLKAVGEHEDDDALVKLVEEGIKGRVIEERERAGAYRFTHAMMQETLLSELSTTRRVRLHGRIGEAMEAIFGPERAERRAAELANHFVESATLTKDHAAKGARYSRLAGEQADAATAPVEAARHYRACLTLVDEAEDGLGEDEAALRTSLGRCLRLAGEYREAWRNLMRAIRMHHEQGDRVRMAKTTLEALLVLAPPDRQRGLVDEALGFLGDADPYLEAQLLVRQARVTEQAGETDRRSLDRADELANAHGFEDVRGGVLRIEAQRAADDLDIDRAIALSREALEIFDRLDNRQLASDVRFVLTRILLFAGDLDEAQAALEEAIEHATRSHIRWTMNVFYSFLAGIHLARCDFNRFETAIAGVTGVMYMAEFLLVSRAEIAGDTARAVELLPPASIAAGVPVDVAQVRGGRARTLFNAGDRDGALTEFQAWVDAHGLLIGHRLFHVFSLSCIGECLPVFGDDALIAEAYREASTWTPLRFSVSVAAWTICAVPWPCV